MEKNLVESEQLELENLIRNRKICWEAEYENCEFAIGEFKVSAFCEKIIGKLEDERMRLQLAHTECINLQNRIKELDTLVVSPSEDKAAIEAIYLKHTGDSFGDIKQGRINKAMYEYGTLCRNKAIEEAVQCVFRNGFTDNENQTEFLISELNKMKV